MSLPLVAAGAAILYLMNDKPKRRRKKKASKPKRRRKSRKSKAKKSRPKRRKKLTLKQQRLKNLAKARRALKRKRK
jgi:hypothetical protein